MPQTLVTLNSPISFLIQSTGDASFPLLTADFASGEVSSTVLPELATDFLTKRIQAIFAAVPVKADLEDGFAGLVNALVSATLLQDGTLEQEAVYAAPTTTLTLSGVTDPATIAITIPYSTSASLVGAP